MMIFFKKLLKKNIVLICVISLTGVFAIYIMDVFFQNIVIKFKNIGDDNPQKMVLIVPVIYSFIVSWVCRGFICIIQQFFLGRLISSVRVDCINYIFDSLNNLEQEYYIRNGSQSLSSYVEKYQNSVCILIQSYVLYIIPPVIFMCYMVYQFFKQSIKMGFTVVIWLVLCIALYIFVYNKKHKRNDLFISNAVKTSSFINDSLNNYELNMVYQLHSRNSKIVRDGLEANRNIERITFSWQGINEFVFTILSIGMFCTVAYYSFMHSLTSFIYFFGFSKFMFWIMWYRMEWMNINQGHMDNIQSIEDIINSLPEKQKGEHNNMEVVGDIVMKDVTFKTNEGKIILYVEDLFIKEGSKVAISGKSGSGKSTLLYLLSKQVKMNSGNIFIGDTNIEHIDSHCFYNQISYISQNNCYFNDSVAYNLRLGKEHATNEELKKVLHSVELSHIDISTSINNLSAGEKQRVNIARALFKESKILFCDEITSHLDNETTHKVQKLIFNLFEHSTIFWIDHSQCIADKSHMSITIDGGQITAIDYKNLS